MTTANSSASKEVVTAALLVIGGKILSGRAEISRSGCGGTPPEYKLSSASLDPVNHEFGVRSDHAAGRERIQAGYVPLQPWR